MIYETDSKINGPICIFGKICCE